MLNIFIKKLFSLSRISKIIIQLVADTMLILFCFSLSIYLRLDDISYFYNQNIILFFLLTISFSLIIFSKLGFYNKIIRYISDKIIFKLAIGTLCSSFFIYLFAEIINIFLPRSIPFIYFAILLICLIGIRLFLKNIYLVYKYDNRIPVAIYGAGEVGRLVLKNLENNIEFEPIIFIDDDRDLYNSEIDNIQVLSLEMATRLIKLKKINIVFFAISNISIQKKKFILSYLEKFNIELKVLPRIDQINESKLNIKDFSNVSIEEILQREEIPPIPKLLKKNVYNKTVMVTGCGGSIGSELCRQILQISPKKIICIDNSEYHLFKISEELKLIKENRNLHTIFQFELSSINDLDSLELIFHKDGIDTIFHTAAYKHVPLVEENILSALKNNIFGTENLVKLAHKNMVKNFILISSDKAVRPTNIMGASKRVAELICQSFYPNQKQTKFTIVRFGNVIGSSGSVIPLFKKQIKNGGPITVTHKNIERYFMTINEAVGLVIQSSALSEGKDIFILDMGKPVKILELAFRMARLMGYNPTLDKIQNNKLTSSIRVKITGLRKGEKLFEELLVDDKKIGTLHPRIFKTFENFINKTELTSILNSLKKDIAKKNIKKIKNDFKQNPINYKSLN